MLFRSRRSSISCASLCQLIGVTWREEPAVISIPRNASNRGPPHVAGTNADAMIMSSPLVAAVSVEFHESGFGAHPAAPIEHAIRRARADCGVLTSMHIGVPRETDPLERRTALVPAAASKLIRSGFTVSVESGAATGAGFTDADYTDVGATVCSERSALLGSADILLKIGRAHV